MGVGQRDTPFLSRHMLIDMDALLDSLFKKPFARGSLYLIATIRVQGEFATHTFKAVQGFPSCRRS